MIEVAALPLLPCLGVPRQMIEAPAEADRLTAQEFTAALERHGLSTREAAELFSMTTRAIQLFKTGGLLVPVLISRILKVAEIQPALIKKLQNVSF